MAVESGFEMGGEFFPWKISFGAKDLLLMDRFSGMPITDFYAMATDSFDVDRAPVKLTLIAMAIRAKYPQWTVERIVRKVNSIENLVTDIVELDREDDGDTVPTPGGQTGPPADDISPSPSDESKPSATPVAA